MTTRRKLGSSLETNKLSSEEVALVKAAEPIPIQKLDKANDEHDIKIAGRIDPKPIPEESPQHPIVKKQKKLSTKRLVAQAEMGEEALVTDSFKLYKSIQNRLLRASFERKVDKTPPYTKQAIVNDALDAWLLEQGF